MKGRCVVDLAEYPDLVVIYLGMRVERPAGLATLLGFGPKITRAVKEQPEGLLLHETLIVSLWPLHLGMRQYWRDFDALERWARSGIHKDWWQRFLRDPKGTSFWHETYFMRGGMEAIYDHTTTPVGLMRFAPVHEARGSMFSARHRLGISGTSTAETPIAEGDLY
jgi:Domain of unknown function (DUF4188)